MDEELESLGSAGAFDRALKQRQENLSTLEGELVSALAGSNEHFRAVFKNPRLNSTSLGQKELALKRSIVKKLDRYEDAAVKAHALHLAISVDMIELQFVSQARAEDLYQRGERFANSGIYEGARRFIEDMFDEHEITTYKLSALNAEDRAVVAGTIKRLLARHFSNG